MKRIAVGLLFCITVLSGQEGGPASDAFYSAIRDNDLTRLQTLLDGGASPNLADPRGGATPLMSAAAVGSLEAMRLLLDKGANVNAASTVGATALMWAATDADKVRLLLSRGADVKAVSQRGRTALFLAARSDRSADIVKLLLAAGADARAVDGAKMTVLSSAVVGNDTDTIRLILDVAGADVNAPDFGGFTPLMHAAGNRNVAAVRLLLAKGADVNARSGDGSFQKVKAGTIALGYFTPLIAAAPVGSRDLIAALLDAGAKVDAVDVRGMTPLMLTIASDRQDLDAIRLLIARGANVNAKSLAGETALDWALKTGTKKTIDVLRRAGAVETAHPAAAIPAAAAADVPTAVERGRMLLTKASTVAAANGGCASCHSHNIVDTVERAGLKKRLPVDDKLRAQRHTLTKAPYFSPANLLERLDAPGSPITTVFGLTALANSGYEPDRTTDAAAANLASYQSRDGGWFIGTVARPPVGEGAIAVTAYAIRALKAFAPAGRAMDMNERLARATSWLAAQKPVTTEDRNMQLLGLFWAGRGAAERERLAKSILAKQRADGGWAQSDDLQSDAYATGLSLFALAESGGISPDHAGYKKGVAYLLSNQRPDGSWYVRSRAVKFQPYFDGGFPYEHDQWISSMATGWATAALTLALP